MAMYLAATAALPVAAGSRRRCVAVSVHCITAFLLLPEELLSLPQLASLPSRWAVDAARIFLGSRAMRLLLFGMGAPLDLPLHLLVHTPCLALVLAQLPYACTKPLLANSTMERRFELFHAIMAAPFAGILPPGYPPGGSSVHCTAAMAFVACLLGWLLPTFLVFKSHCQTVRARLQQAHCDDAAGSSAGSSGGCAGSGGERPPAPPPSAARDAVAADMLAKVCAEWLFMDGALVEMRAHVHNCCIEPTP
ncbi:hypothetical protein ABPG75_013944 [Micractinium tetrahymenae]